MIKLLAIPSPSPFVCGNAGPYYLSTGERDGLKFDSSTGEKKIKLGKKCYSKESRQHDIRFEDASPKMNWREESQMKKDLQLSYKY